MSFPHGMGIALVDSSLCVLFAYLAQHHFRPAHIVQWCFFVLFGLLAILFFLAWLIDLGAHL